MALTQETAQSSLELASSVPRITTIVWSFRRRVSPLRGAMLVQNAGADTGAEGGDGSPCGGRILTPHPGLWRLRLAWRPRNE